MARATTKGKCLFCNQVFSKAGMTKHLATCPAKITADNNVSSRGVSNKIFHLMVEGYRMPDYWMHLEISAKTTLDDLDHFLRGKWLECCGHLSAFEIGDTYYSNDAESADEIGDESMRAKLGKVLAPGLKFKHDYDFGTTTELVLKVVGVREGLVAKTKDVKLLAENEAPDVRCGECGKVATQICGQCSWEGDAEGWLCDACAEEHECGEDMMLPVVNSPRVGMCAYSG